MIIRRRLHKGNWKIVTIPNILTLGRIACIPFFVLTFFVQSLAGKFIGLILFILASLTDYVDGYVARKFRQTSRFGSFLDPIADKLLITVTLLMLAGTGSIRSFNLIPAALIICRELIISGLREFLAAMGLELPVLKLAKYKTMVQMIALTCFLLYSLFTFSNFLFFSGTILLWLAGLLALVTAVSYLASAMSFIKILQRQQRHQIPKRSRRKSA